ncbi:MAG: sigma-54 dependent transcriptional regulator [Bacteroidota bacterium]
MPDTLGRLLVVDDDEDVLQALRLLLRRHADRVHTEKDPHQIPALLKNGAYDLILLDMNFTQDAGSGREGFYWLDRILELDPSAVVVMITAFGDVSTAVRAIKEGATDFVLKPWQNEKLLATLSAARQLRASRVEAEQLRSRQAHLQASLDQPFQEFVGQSEAMRRVFETIRKVAPTDANVLILGENGTGKELVARAIHRASARTDEVFVSVDMGAIPEALFESELFGHKKGAFTDAKEDRAGRIEAASGGTLFLDEIGNLSLPLQAKVLSVLQSRHVVRVGANKPRAVDVRVVSATNMPIHDMVGEHTFRQDLLYRINTVEIRLPPLRDRLGDVPLLTDHFLQRYARKYQRPITGVSPVALKKLEKYPWPGNVRELQHMVERAVIMTDASRLQPEDFFFAASAISEEDEVVFDSYNLEDVEKLVIRKAIDKHDGNISRAAEELGLTRASLYRRLEKYGL